MDADGVAAAEFRDIGPLPGFEECVEFVGHGAGSFVGMSNHASVPAHGETAKKSRQGRT
jgi:hypothetical protein